MISARPAVGDGPRARAHRTQGNGNAAHASRAAEADELFPQLYEELCRLAHRHRRAWNGNDTLNTHALVHEAYLKLAPPRGRSWESEAHFLAAAGTAIRHILLNYARDRSAAKRGGERRRVALNDETLVIGDPGGGDGWGESVLALEEALIRLAERSERQSRIVECRFFAGMTVQQTAAALDLSVPTVTRGWAMAKAWLHRELTAPKRAEEAD